MRVSANGEKTENELYINIYPIYEATFWYRSLFWYIFFIEGTFCELPTQDLATKGHSFNFEGFAKGHFLEESILLVCQKTGLFIKRIIKNV